MVQSSPMYQSLQQYQERVEAEVEVNIYIDMCVCVCMCVSVKIGQNHTFSLFFGHNQPGKCNTCVLLFFS